MTGTTATQSAAEDARPTGTGSTESPLQDAQSRTEGFLNGFLAAMVTIYGILTALIIFAASRAESLYYDNVFISQAQLSDASELSIEAQIRVLHDLSVLEQMQAHELSGSDPKIIEFLHGHLSAEAQASLERSGGVDETYAEEVYFAHNVVREKAMRSFDLAAAWSERANTYERLATLLAVGLAFAAWASLIKRIGSIRWMFTIVAASVLIGSLGFLGVLLATREPLEKYLTFLDNEGHTSVEEPGYTLAGGLYAHPSGAFEFAVLPDHIRRPCYGSDHSMRHSLIQTETVKGLTA